MGKFWISYACLLPDGGEKDADDHNSYDRVDVCTATSAGRSKLPAARELGVKQVSETEIVRLIHAR